ncbi:MAG: glycosyltransferase [Bacteroidetes bacterium]|nr:glycosyltransferase [Bacteroidota bacterium]
MPFFSIIIPTFNRAQFIEKTIQSVLNQEYIDYEILVVDDGSTDNTEEIIKLINSDKIQYFKKRNEERAVARNTGIRLAKGNYITFLDSDDLFYPEHLQIAYENIQINNSPEIIHTRYEIINNQNKVISKMKILDDKINRKLISGNFMSCNGVFLRKDIALTNLFNENRDLSALEDWELWLRLAAQYKIYYSNTITSAIINHDDRSVLNTKKEELIRRFDILISLVLKNTIVINYYKNNINAFKSSCYTYISLHLALTKKYRKEAIKYLFMGISQKPETIFSRRFLAIIKHII